MDAHARKRIAVNGVKFIDDSLRGGAFLARFQGDGRAMLIRTANKNDIAAPASQVADVDIGWQVCTGHLANMQGSIGIGKGSGDQVSGRFGHENKGFG